MVEWLRRSVSKPKVGASIPLNIFFSPFFPSPPPPPPFVCFILTFFLSICLSFYLFFLSLLSFPHFFILSFSFLSYFPSTSPPFILLSFFLFFSSIFLIYPFLFSFTFPPFFPVKIQCFDIFFFLFPLLVERQWFDYQLYMFFSLFPPFPLSHSLPLPFLFSTFFFFFSPVKYLVKGTYKFGPFKFLAVLLKKYFSSS